MLQELQVRHFEYETTRSFEDVIGTFERLVGTVEGIGWESAQNVSKSVAEFESKVKENIGPSGFMRFLTIDHGSWLSLLGQPAEMRMYTIGNPLIAITMLRHNIAAGLNVPVRLVIYRDEASGTTRLTYDQPSGLMSGIGNPSLMEAAAVLDAKLAALAEQVTGAKAN
jgi:uncharacterized protein (DUF302 family)